MDFINGQYRIQNIPLGDIASEFDTPLYVYDADKIIKQVQKLKSAFESVNLRIKYAAKALTNPAILKLIGSEGARLDTVSINEARLGMLAGFKPEEIWSHNPEKLKDLFRFTNAKTLQK